MTVLRTNPNAPALTVLLAISGVACLLALAGWWLGGLGWITAGGLLLNNLLLVFLIRSLVRWESHRERGDLYYRLGAMCVLQDQPLGTDPEQLVPAVAGNDPWRAVLTEVREFSMECRRRLQECEQLRASAEIRARRARGEREQLSVILAGLPDPVIAVNHYDELALANLSAMRMFRLDSIEDANEPLDAQINCPALVELVLDVRRRKTPTQRTTEFTWHDLGGQERWYHVTCRNLDIGREGDAMLGGAVAILTDITFQKAVQRRNAEFVSAVSHEMKTPLSGIKAYVELLADGDAEDEQTRDEFLEVINSQADRLQRLIDNLLNLARIEAGVVNVNKHHHSLNEILEECFGILQPSAEKKDIQLQLELSPMYLGVKVDRDLLLQAAINLLSNAVKYTEAGGRVTLRSRLAANEVSFEVEDTGVGLSDEDCHRIFDKFYRVRKNQQMASGTGLGLPLVKHIVEDVHGGQLEVHSQLEQGSTFGVVLASSASLQD